MAKFKRFTFKKEVHYADFARTLHHEIKLDGEVCGTITQVKPGVWVIKFACRTAPVGDLFDKGWRWTLVKPTFHDADSAKLWVREHNDRVQQYFNLKLIGRN